MSVTFFANQITTLDGVDENDRQQAEQQLICDFTIQVDADINDMFSGLRLDIDLQGPEGENKGCIVCQTDYATDVTSGLQSKMTTAIDTAATVTRVAGYGTAPNALSDNATETARKPCDELGVAAAALAFWGSPASQDQFDQTGKESRDNAAHATNGFAAKLAAQHMDATQFGEGQAASFAHESASAGDGEAQPGSMFAALLARAYEKRRHLLDPGMDADENTAHLIKMALSEDDVVELYFEVNFATKKLVLIAEDTGAGVAEVAIPARWKPVGRTENVVRACLQLKQTATGAVTQAVRDVSYTHSE